MTAVQPVNVDDILGYFDACFGNETGKLHIASGWGIHATEHGKLEHDTWTPTCFDYPTEARQAANELAQSALAGADVYVCPYLMHGGKRHKGAAKTRRILHADVDSSLDLQKIRNVGGCVVISGSPDHGHVYIRLDREVTEAEHDVLERGLVHYLGADPGKISENDVLRPPGTLNQKPTVSGSDPAQVMWLILPNGAVPPESVATKLGVNLAVNSSRAPIQIGSPEQINLSDYPAVLTALAKITFPEDRSLDTDHIVRACYDSGLTLSQARWVVNTRKDLAERLANRPNTDDDVGRCWLKIDAERRKTAQSSAWIRELELPAPKSIEVDQQPSRLEDIERGFWDSRESLQIIYTAALARMVSPWAVLAFCAARALTQVRPNWVLPPIVGGGGGGSLNWFAAIVDRSGGGKTAAKGLAKELVTGEVREKNLGSGEGIIGQFYKPPTKQGDTAEIHEANMFSADEVESLGALGSRTGSTMMSTLRSAFSGDTLGFSYIAKGRDVHLDAHTYRLTMVVGVQPGKAGVLLDESVGGTPQRFMWFPANDDRIDAAHQSDWIPGPIEMPTLELYPRVLTIPPEAKELIIATRAQSGRGEISALDGHALFCREKFAYSLALLDGRIAMNSEDWALSGIAAEVSDRTRDHMITELMAAREQEASEKGRLLGISGSMSDEEKIIRTGERLQRIIRWALRKLEEKGPLTPREFTQAASSRDRPWLEMALNDLRISGLARINEEGKWDRLT